MKIIETIKTGIALPHAKGSYKPEQQAFLKLLKGIRISIGKESDQSFVISKDAQTSMYKLAKNYGMKIRTFKENGTGIRVWRVT